MDLSVMKYFWIVIVLVHFFVFEVNGQCSDTTRPYQVNATYEPQYIVSPNYPKEYPENQDCAWLITAPTDHDKIIINIEDLETEGASFPCSVDYLTLYDGGDDQSPEVAKLCTKNSDDLKVFVSSTASLYITFHSDAAYNFNGFRILVFSNNTDNQPGCSSNTTLTATSNPQVLMSHNLPDPYGPNLICITLIYPETQYFAINIELYFMNMSDSAQCEEGSLEISSVTETTTDVLSTDCGSAVPDTFPLVVTGSYAQLNFSTGNVSDNYYGYMLKYYEIFKGINLTSPANGSTIYLTFPEDEPTGHLNESIAVIVLTYTGSLELQILPSYEQTTDEPINIATDIQIFSLTDEPPYIYLDLISNFDYEVVKKFNLLVTIVDTDVRLVTYSVTFDITITDVNDIAPTFGNLPNNQTLKRGEKKGLHLYTINATDDDATEPNQQIEFEIFSGNTDSMFELNSTSGELVLARDAKDIGLHVTEYVLNIAAYSGDTGNRLATFSDYTVYIDPDSPPTCSREAVWAEILDANLAVAGDVLKYVDDWRCSDDRDNVTYELAAVFVGNLTSDLFDVNPDNAEVKLLRSFDITEALTRQFVLEIRANDSVGQSETFNVTVNVTALTCLPNPRRLYVRMDQEINGVILSSFNCTHEQGMTYTLTQYPPDTFDVVSTPENTGQLVLKQPVIKLTFYSLSITITDDLDIATLNFQVIIQTRRCLFSHASFTNYQKSLVYFAFAFLLNMFTFKLVLF